MWGEGWLICWIFVRYLGELVQFDDYHISLDIQIPPVVRRFRFVFGLQIPNLRRCQWMSIGYYSKEKVKNLWNFTYRFTRLLPQPWFSGTCVPSRWTSFKIEVSFLFFHRKKWWWEFKAFLVSDLRTVTPFLLLIFLVTLLSLFLCEDFRKSRWRILGFAPDCDGWEGCVLEWYQGIGTWRSIPGLVSG